KGDVGRLADVFCALADYCTDSFEQIFPPREGAKLAALRWFSEARFSSQCPKADVSVDDAGDVARLKDALLKLRPALEKRFSSSGAPFPLILYKRVTEWEKSIETVIQSAKQVDESVDPSVDQSAAQSINRPVDQSPNPAGQPVTPKSTASSTDNPQAPVVIKLNHGEYQKILDCIETIKTLIKERR
ncbi:MAG: hypothetical protein LBU70_07630, partial [Chitinispirillales bacterium]|nr:hypothetical protein [Chitinispirillales bacterium]